VEEEQKRQEDEAKERRRVDTVPKATGAPGSLVSPGDLDLVEVETEDASLNKNLFGIMFGEEDEGQDGVNRSPPKNKPKKASNERQLEAKKNTEGPGPKKNAEKSALKAGFKDSHVYNFPRTLVEASIELKGELPMQEFIVALQELLKNGQMVDKNFAFCLVNNASGDKKINNPSGIPTNMTLLSGHFKILYSRGRNPFEKQKVFKNNKEVKGEFKNPSIYFSMAIATDKDPKELLARIVHEWHRRGGITLRVKEL
jgi:hypothetical protein